MKTMSFMRRNAAIFSQYLFRGETTSPGFIFLGIDEMKMLPAMILVFAIAGLGFAQQGQSKQESKESKLTEADQLRIAVQGICPVMGAKLGSMGEPIKVKLGDQIGYLCCKACTGKKVKAEHWQKIQQNIAAAQGTCPIMGKPVDATMKSTVIKGHRIFVCCPPCIDKIRDDENGSIKKLYANYVAYIKKQQQSETDGGE